MTAGRKPLKATETIDMENTVDQPRIDNAMTVARSDAQAEQMGVTTDVFALGRLVGAAQMAGSISAISAVAEVRAFEEVNKSKVFKSLYINIGGDFRPAENIDEFCRVVFGGRGYKSMMERKAALEKLGEEMYESVSRLGLNRTQLRLLVNLPEDTRTVVEEAMHASDKSEVVTLIQSLANQLDEAKEKTEELKADIAAKEGLLAKRASQIDELDQKLARAKVLPPDEVLGELQAEASKHLNDVRGAFIGKFSQAVSALFEHAEMQSGAADMAFLAGLIGQLQADISALRDRYGIPDIAPALIPEWVNDPSFETFAG